MTQINTKIVADSISPQGHRITTMLLTYPRMIHSELMTHRMFSRNSASSRAIPFNKMVKKVEEDPFIPIAFQKDHKGMQGTEYLEGKDHELAKNRWIMTAEEAADYAKFIHNVNVTKQLCNRLLEPFMWHTILVTATEFDNFFELRCPKYVVGEGKLNEPISTFKSKKDAIKEFSGLKDLTQIEWLQNNESGAEIHIQALAEAMWDAMNESEPQQLEEGQWHIPFGDQFDENLLDRTKFKIADPDYYKRKIATAKCARLSYETHGGEVDYEKDIHLHDRLLEKEHMSPFEHVAKAMSDEEYHTFIKTFYGNYESFLLMSHGEERNIDAEEGWCNNFRGFIPYRYMVEEGVVYNVL